MPTPSSQGSPFWRFSLQFYRLPKVADACIALQEEAGVDVNLLLFLLWQAQPAPPALGRRRCGAGSQDRALARRHGDPAAQRAARAEVAAGAGRGRDRGSLPQPDQGGGARSRAVAAGGDVRAGAARRRRPPTRTRPRAPMSRAYEEMLRVRVSAAAAAATLLAAFASMPASERPARIAAPAWNLDAKILCDLRPHFQRVVQFLTLWS